ncbi:Uncharacterised protein [uncultured archaeon]|nr:Uncharacterised protein [uncultured archaeon]
MLPIRPFGYGSYVPGYYARQPPGNLLPHHLHILGRVAVVARVSVDVRLSTQIHDVHKGVRAYKVVEKLVSHALAKVRPRDEARHVDYAGRDVPCAVYAKRVSRRALDAQLLVHALAHHVRHAEIRLYRREGVGRYVRLDHRERGEHRRLALVRRAYYSN